jgi:hypothetical protein
MKKRVSMVGGADTLRYQSYVGTRQTVALDATEKKGREKSEAKKML